MIAVPLFVTMLAAILCAMFIRRYIKQIMMVVVAAFLIIAHYWPASPQNYQPGHLSTHTYCAPECNE